MHPRRFSAASLATVAVLLLLSRSSTAIPRPAFTAPRPAFTAPRRLASLTESGRAGLVAIHQSQTPLESVLDYAIYDSVFPRDSLDDRLLRAVKDARGAPRPGEVLLWTPMLDVAENEGVLRPRTMAYDGAAKVRAEALGIEEGVVSVAEGGDGGCDAEVVASCRAIEAACLVVSRAVVDGGGCMCSSMAPECLACTQMCGWTFCSTAEFHTVIVKDASMQCPPPGYSMDLYGSYSKLRGKLMPAYG